MLNAHLLACLRSDKEARMQASDSCYTGFFSLCSHFNLTNSISVSFVRHGTPACHTTFYKMNRVQQGDHLSTVIGP